MIETLQRLQQESKQIFDPYRMRRRSDRLQWVWVMKDGFAEWFTQKTQARQAFFPLPR